MACNTTASYRLNIAWTDPTATPPINEQPFLDPPFNTQANIRTFTQWVTVLQLASNNDLCDVMTLQPGIFTITTAPSPVPAVVHTNVGNEYVAATGGRKLAPIGPDRILIENSQSVPPWDKAYIEIGNLPGGGGGGTVDSVVAGTGITVDATDPANPIVSASGQTITLTGDVTGSGTGSFAATIANDAVTNANAANMAQSTIKGRAAAAGTGDPTDLTPDQASTVLELATDPFARSSNVPPGFTILTEVGNEIRIAGDLIVNDGTSSTLIFGQDNLSDGDNTAVFGRANTINGTGALTENSVIFGTGGTIDGVVNAALFSLSGASPIVTTPESFNVYASEVVLASANIKLPSLSDGLLATTGGTGVVAPVTIGTGVQTALGVNVGSAGAPIVNGGALGTPSSGTATNLTGTASGLSIGGNAATVTNNANLTGPVTSTGNATAIADAALSIAKTSGLQTALDAKAPLASPTFTGTVTLPVALTGVLRADAGVVSTDGDVTDLVSAATTTLAGKVELATDGENAASVVVQGNDNRINRDQFCTMSADATSTSTSLANITNMATANLAAGGMYRVDAYLVFRTAATTTGIGFSLNGSAAATTVQGEVVITTSLTAAVRDDFRAYDEFVAAAGIDAAATNVFARLSATIMNAGSASTLAARFASEVGGSTVTVEADGSWMMVTQIN